MSEDAAVLTGEHYWNGGLAATEGALAAGCRFFAGYPITPSTEAPERASERMPEVGGMFIQMEDELASMNAILGASWAGKKAMTATSGPGFSLMMENLGLGVMMETPCVILNVQRGGPSTGLPTLVAQSDVMQARWGSHGDYEIIALTPNSPQESFDIMIEAFNLSEQWRVPVIVLSDEAVGHMTEKVVVPPADQIKLVPRRYTERKPEDYLPFEVGDDLVPLAVEAGWGYRIHVTGLTHNEKGYPAVNPVDQHRLVERLVRKIRDNAAKIIRIEEDQTADADVVVVSYGITSRIAQLAVNMARERGIKAGMLRLITIWPFCERRIRELSQTCKAFVVAEINLGQIFYEVERCAGDRARTLLLPHSGGAVHRPDEIVKKIEEAA